MPPTETADAATLAVELHAVLGLLSRRARAATAATELSASQRSVVARLLREGPATTADLARAEFVRPQSMRMTLGALEERGLIARTPHPTDGRQVLVELSEAGKATIAGIMQSKQDWLTSAIAGDLDARQRAALAAALPVLRSLAGTDATRGTAARPAGANPTASPTAPTGPTAPTEPTGPASPTAPTAPAGPGGRTGPASPTGSVGPTPPTGPGGPTAPTGPSEPAAPTGARA